MSDAIINGAIYGGIAGGIAVLVLMPIIIMLQKPKPCPECGVLLPKIRKPANRQQMLWGGSTCANCGTEVDRRGGRIK